MALTDGTLNLVGTYLAGLITHISLHSADPGAGGANEVGTRQAVTWSVDADGDLTLVGTESFTGLAANQAIHSVGYQSALSGGTFRGSNTVTGDATANAAGEYNVTGITVNGTST